MSINVIKLHWELEKAGIPILGCSEDGRIDYKDEATDEQKQAGAAILTAHTIEWYVEKRVEEYPPLSDQIDSIYKICKKLKIDGNDLGEDGESWIAQIDAIKTKYPKN